MSATYQMVCPDKVVPPRTYAACDMRIALDDPGYEGDKVRVSLLAVGQSHTDADGDVWTRVS